MRLVQLPGWFSSTPPTGGDKPAAPPTAQVKLPWLRGAKAAPAVPQPGAAESPETSPAAIPPPLWTARRVELLAELWGPGHMAPGGAPEMMRYALPLGLTSAATLLVLGSGAGGLPLCLAAGLGVWVSAFEANPVLLAMSRQLVERDPNTLAKRVTLAAWDEAQPELPANAFHHGVMHEHVRDAAPAQVLSIVAAALKPHGQLVLVQTVAAPASNAADPQLQAWSRLDGRTTAPPTAEAVETALTRLGFDIRVHEDMTARHIKLATAGWKTLLRGLSATRPDHGRTGTIINEAELWNHRIHLLQDKKLRLIRWHAIKNR